MLLLPETTVACCSAIEFVFAEVTAPAAAAPAAAAPATQEAAKPSTESAPLARSVVPPMPEPVRDFPLRACGPTASVRLAALQVTATAAVSLIVEGEICQ